MRKENIIDDMFDMVKGSWIELPMKVNLNNCLCREVLFEKYDIKNKKQLEMIEFFMRKLNNCMLFVNDSYPDYIFYGKHIEESQQIEILMEQNIKNKAFYLKYSGLWSVFEIKYEMNYIDICCFVKNIIHCLLRLENYRILQHPVIFDKMFDNYVKVDDYKASWKEFGCIKEF